MPKSHASVVLLGFVCFAATVHAAEKLPAGVACLLEENAAELLPKLTNPQGDPGEGQVEKGIVFSGKESIKITILQRYCNFIPGWAYRITEKPKEGEYRYLRFAWKSDGLTGIMLQLHDVKDWYIRYTAGANKFGWESKMVAETLPQEWTVVTIDLFKDFGEREIHGIALTTFDGTAGYFDHIYFARSVAELDAIDATGLGAGEPLKLTPDEVEQHWGQLTSGDASVAYRSFWTLAAAGESARPLLAAKVGGEAVAVDAATIADWLKQLDADEFATREKATTQLTAHLTQARAAMEDELKRTTSAEVRARLGRILLAADTPLTAAQRTEQQTRRILQIIAERAKR
jgi:hypothetical protein